MSAVFAALALAAATPATGGSVPRVLVLDGQRMAALRSELQAGESEFAPAVAELRAEADKVLDKGPWTVVDKKLTPPSGDKHDYMSVGPYWWPDPTKPDGKPYIRKDGKVNPERNGYDNVGLSHTVKNSSVLALAWYYTGDERYASHAATLLRTWFIDPKTRMNPNLNYGQAIPGRCEGRGIGIIDTGCLIGAIDTALLLELSAAWTDEDALALRAWFAEYLSWLRDSKNGKEEDKTHNNHGTWYDAQVASFAIYTGQPELARTVLEVAKKRRITPQIKADGTQPHELARTNSWGYSNMNLRGFFIMAALGKHVGVDLWSYPTADAPLLRKALDYLIPFAKDETSWPHEQIHSFKGSQLAELLRWASVAYDNPAYEQAVPELFAEGELAKQRFQLTHPARD
jgi:hypothetical protein